LSEIYEFGLFNADKEKILTANEVSDSPEWSWLYDTPFGITYSEDEAFHRVVEINHQRAETGQLATHGSVVYQRRTVTYGEWE